MSTHKEMTKEEIRVGQRWIHNVTGKTMRIMAIAEKCAMCRYKGAMPFIEYLDNILLKYKINPQTK